jgi:hypothetical protein
MAEDLWFERLAEASGELMPERAPAKLKSRTYSALVARMAESGSLLDLMESRNSGGRLCVFETALTVVPLGTNVSAMNPCRICHARILGEQMEHAPIFWPGCPYSEFHNG